MQTGKVCKAGRVDSWRREGVESRHRGGLVVWRRMQLIINKPIRRKCEWLEEKREGMTQVSRRKELTWLGKDRGAR